MADEKNTTDETAADEAAAEATPEDAPVEEPVSAPEGPIAPTAEVVEEAPVAEAEPAGDEPSAPAPAPAEEASGDEPPDGAPLAEGTSDTPAGAVATNDEPVAPAEAPLEVQRKKRKRLPRALRPQRTRPKRERPATRKAIVRLPKPEAERGRRQERRGVVVSSASDKTIVVKVDTVKAHRRYKKVVRRSRKFHAHDEANRAKVGDVVRIIETRPLSKLKNWRLVEVVEEAK